MFKPFKYILVAVAIELDDDGNPIAEHASKESVHYGKEKLFSAVEEFEDSLNNFKIPTATDA